MDCRGEDDGRCLSSLCVTLHHPPTLINKRAFAHAPKGIIVSARLSRVLHIKVRKLDRIQEVPHEGAMCDLLWSILACGSTAQLLLTTRTENRQK